MYQVTVRGAQILNEEGRLQTLEVNGSEYSVTVPYAKEWTDFDFGMVRLNKGKNTLKLIKKYGYMAVDYVTVSEGKFPDMSIADAVITSAVELTDDEKHRLERKLTDVTGKKIRASYVIDKSIIGGVSIAVDGKNYDGSVRKNLKNLKEVMS